MTFQGSAPHHIDLFDPLQVKYWTERLGITEGELRQACCRVGASAPLVVAYFGDAQESAESGASEPY